MNAAIKINGNREGGTKMILIIISALALVVGITLLIYVNMNKYRRMSDRYCYIGVTATGFGGVALFIQLMCWPAYYYNDISSIQQYHAAKQTIAQARTTNTSELERAALTTKIIEVNSWLANAKYWNDSIFDIYIPDEVEELEPLK
jgi:hypothetical protein